MDFEPSSLIASLVVSSVGFVVFVYGKHQQRVPQVVVGLALMGFPYLVPSVAIMGLCCCDIPSESPRTPCPYRCDLSQRMEQRGKGNRYGVTLRCPSVC